MKNRVTNEYIDNKLLNRNIIRCENSKGSISKIKWKCLIDGHEWITTPNSIIDGNRGCPKCGNQIEWTDEIIDEKIIEKKLKIKRLTKIKNSLISIKWKCLIDGHEWKSTVNDVISYCKGCSKCAGNLKHTNKSIDNIISKTYVKRVGDYINAKTKIEWKCKLCSNNWFTKPSHILCGHSCPLCKKKGELKVKNILEFFGIDFIHNKRLILNDKIFIPDFLFTHKNKQYIIEYNGQQHYKPTDFGGKNDNSINIAFIKQKERDNILKEACKTNNIELIEIPYWETNNIENILRLRGLHPKSKRVI